MLRQIFLRKTRPTPLLQLNKSPDLLRHFLLSSITSATPRCFFSCCTNNKRSNTRKPPTSDSYDQQITVAGCSRDFTTLHRLLNERAKDRCFNTTNTFRFLINEKDPSSFLLLLDQLLETLSHLDQGSPRKDAYDLLIASLCKSHHRIQESHRVINIMIEGNYGINPSTFHPLLNALTRKRRYDEAWGVLTFMRDKGILIDITAYNYLLMAYCVDGDLKAAAGVLEKILEDDDGCLKEDQKVYDAMILGACRVGKVEGALLIFRRMEEAGVPVRYSTHAHVINGLLGLGYFEQAVEFVLAVGGRDKRLDSESFGHLGNCLVKRKRVEEAKLVFGEMEKRGLMVGTNLKNDYMRLLSSSSVVAD